MWAYALKFAITVYNKTPKSKLNFKTPYELFHERPSTIKYFRRFGCLSYVLNTDPNSKMSERGIDGFLIACGDTFYYVIEPSTGKVYKSKHAIFIQSKTYGDFYNKQTRKTIIKDPKITNIFKVFIN